MYQPFLITFAPAAFLTWSLNNLVNLENILNDSIFLKHLTMITLELSFIFEKDISATDLKNDLLFDRIVIAFVLRMA